MKSFFANVLGLLGLAVLLVATGLVSGESVRSLWSAVAAKAAPPKPPEAAPAPPPVTVAKAAPEDFVETVLVTGTLVPRQEIMVAPEVDGLRVLDLKVDEGAHVKKGEVLSTLVSDTLEAQLAEKDAAIAKAGAAIAQAQTQITDSAARAEQAKAQLERAKPLQKSGYLSNSEFDQREQAARSTAALAVAAREGLKVAEAEKARVEAERREIAFKLSKTEVRAPADGLVSRRTGRVGAVASGGGEAMFRIIENGEVELDAEVPEADLAKIKLGQTARISLAGLSEAVQGTVRLISPEVEKASRLGRVRVFLGENPALHIGAFGRGRIETNKSRGIAVPASAIMHGSDVPYVQVVVNKTVAKRAVELGLRTGERVEIRKGLTEGEQVVAKAGTFLREGDTVEPVLSADKVSEAGR